MFGRTWRSLIVVAAGLTGIWYATTFTAANVFALSDPDQALRFDNDNFTALGKAALADFHKAPEAATQVEGIAKRALILSPLNTDAAAALGLAYLGMGRKRQASQAFDYVERLTRRNLAVELVRIEESVEQGRIDGALLRYDRIMRYDFDWMQQLIPVLAQASNDRDVAADLTTYLARRPPYWRPLLHEILSVNTASDTLLRVARSIRLDPAVNEERNFISATMKRLIALGRADLAWSWYAQLRPDQAGLAGSIRNGGFETANGWPPFDWELASDNNFSALPSPGNGGMVLTFNMTEGASGRAATQYLRLTPGKYAFQLRAGEISGTEVERPLVTIKCDKGTALMSLRLPAIGSQGKAVRAYFTVPGQECAGQSLAIDVVSPLNPTDAMPWVDDLRVSPSH